MFDRWSALLERPEFDLPPGLLEEAIGGKTVLVTGAAGTVGQALCRLILRGQPARLVLLDSHEASLVRLVAGLEIDGVARANVYAVLADVRDRQKIDQILRRYPTDLVFHLAAYKQVPLAESNVDQVLSVNVLGTATVLACAMSHGAAALAFPSTDKAVHPYGVYGATKRIVERYLASLALSQSGTSIRVVRLVNVFGSQGSVAEVFARQIEVGLPIGITDVRMDRYWMTMAEATRLLVAASTRPNNEGIYLLDVGEPVPLLETARRVHRLLRPAGGEPEIRLIGVRPGERLHEPLHYEGETREQTPIPGLTAVTPLPSRIAADEWLRAIAELRLRLYDVPSTALQSWAFAASTGEMLPAFPASGS